MLLGGIFGQTTWAEEPPIVPLLWQPAPPSPAIDHPPTTRKSWVLHNRDITLDLALLKILKDAGSRPHPRIVIELFGGDRHELGKV